VRYVAFQIRQFQMILPRLRILDIQRVKLWLHIFEAWFDDVQRHVSYSLLGLGPSDDRRTVEASHRIQFSCFAIEHVTFETAHSRFQVVSVPTSPIDRTVVQRCADHVLWPALDYLLVNAALAHSGQFGPSTDPTNAIRQRHRSLHGKHLAY